VTTEFTIDRKVWLRALPRVPKDMPIDDIKATGSYLLREIDQKRCCLGIYLQACGVKDEDLQQVGSPGYMCRNKPHVRPLVPNWLIGSEDAVDRNSILSVSLMEFNDDDTCSDAKKESFIIETFAGQGIKVTFV
jgi:hypothetical protein